MAKIGNHQSWLPQKMFLLVAQAMDSPSLLSGHDYRGRNIRMATSNTWLPEWTIFGKRFLKLMHRLTFRIPVIFNTFYAVELERWNILSTSNISKSMFPLVKDLRSQDWKVPAGAWKDLTLTLVEDQLPLRSILFLVRDLMLRNILMLLFISIVLELGAVEHLLCLRLPWNFMGNVTLGCQTLVKLKLKLLRVTNGLVEMITTMIGSIQHLAPSLEQSQMMNHFACCSILLSKKFKNACHDPRPPDKNYKYINMIYQNKKLASLFGRCAGLRELIEAKICVWIIGRSKLLMWFSL